MPDPCAAVATLIDAIEAGEVDAARAAYHPDAVIWHNDGTPEQSVEENLRTLGWMVEHLPGLRYTEVRRQPTPDGCVEQHVLLVPIPGRPEPLALPACLICDVDGDGLITRLAEYLDTAALAPLLEWAAGA